MFLFVHTIFQSTFMNPTLNLGLRFTALSTLVTNFNDDSEQLYGIMLFSLPLAD